jgi:hypothetical protein
MPGCPDADDDRRVDRAIDRCIRRLVAHIAGTVLALALLVAVAFVICCVVLFVAHLAHWAQNAAARVQWRVEEGAVGGASDPWHREREPVVQHVPIVCEDIDSLTDLEENSVMCSATSKRAELVWRRREDIERFSTRERCVCPSACPVFNATDPSSRDLELACKNFRARSRMPVLLRPSDPAYFYSRR